MNLVLNARHALVDGGVLSIRSYLPPPRSHSRERFVCVGVSDTGVGIREEVMSRIFEPYFTTRLPGKGTGLGLAICRRIVTDHRGRISVRSRPGEGSTFSIELPACTEEAP